MILEGETAVEAVETRVAVIASHQTGRELYCKQDGQPILLLCNGAPDTPDITAVVYCTTGRALDWSPRLSAGTGSPEPVEGVDDFSQHPAPGAAP